MEKHIAIKRHFFLKELLSIIVLILKLLGKMHLVKQNFNMTNKTSINNTEKIDLQNNWLA